MDIYLSPPIMDVSETPISIHHVPANSAAPISTSASVASISSVTIFFYFVLLSFTIFIFFFAIF